MLLLNNVPVNYFTFPGGEIQVKLPEEILPESCVLTWMPKDPTSIMLVLLTVNALKHKGICDITLECLYLPYARQDRVCSPGEAFSLEVICSLLDKAGFTCIKFWDLHNEEKTFDLFTETALFHTEAYDIFKHFKILDNFDMDNMRVCAPDYGSHSRVNKVQEKLDLYMMVLCAKQRNMKTGVIEELSIDDLYSSPDGDDILVIDDICDGGRTFIECAKLLKENGAEKLYLYVTHGIFSKGLGELLDHYEHIYCHHTFHPLLNDHERLTVLRKFDVN